MRRTPVRTVLFFLLVGMAALLSTGGGLWKMCRGNMIYFESLFQTIATVEQKPERIVKEESWDWENEKYTSYNYKEYGEAIPLSVLDFEGANYISGPETRAWYAAYVPDYLTLDPTEGVSNVMVVECSPVEDGIPAGPLKMEIKNTLYSYYPYNAPPFISVITRIPLRRGCIRIRLISCLWWRDCRMDGGIRIGALVRVLMNMFSGAESGVPRRRQTVSRYPMIFPAIIWRR